MVFYTVLVWYDCPKCGLKNSSDGEHFCGKCEEEYMKAQEELEIERKNRENESRDLIGD